MTLETEVDAAAHEDGTRTRSRSTKLKAPELERVAGDWFDGAQQGRRRHRRGIRVPWLLLLDERALVLLLPGGKWYIGPNGCGSTVVGLYGSGSGPPEDVSLWTEWSGSDWVAAIHVSL